MRSRPFAVPGAIAKCVSRRTCRFPQLAAVLERCALFLGHDSGVSHIAAAVGTPCVLLFGATDPHVWAPANPNVRVVRAPTRELKDVTSGEVYENAHAVLKAARSQPSS